MRSDAAVLSVLAAAALVVAMPVAAQVRKDLGQREYEAKCAVCHGLDAKGRGPYADSLKQPVPDLTMLARRNGGLFPVARTYAQIEGAGPGHGTREMPVWGLGDAAQAVEQLPDLPYNQAQFVRTRIMALLEYLNQLQQK